MATRSGANANQMDSTKGYGKLARKPKKQLQWAFDLAKSFGLETSRSKNSKSINVEVGLQQKQNQPTYLYKKFLKGKLKPK